MEAFLLLQIALCIGSSSVVEPPEYTRYNSRYLQSSEQRLLLRTITVNTGLVFNLFYWWRGLDVMKSIPYTSREEHGTYGFYFIKVNLYGWMRTAMKTTAVMALVNYLFTCTGQNLTEAIQSLRLQEIRREFIRAVGILESSAVRPSRICPFPEITALSAVNKAILGVSTIISTSSFSRMHQPRQENNSVNTIHLDSVSTAATTPAVALPPSDLDSPIPTLHTRPPIALPGPNPPELIPKSRTSLNLLKTHLFRLAPLTSELIQPALLATSPDYRHHSFTELRRCHNQNGIY